MNTFLSSLYILIGTYTSGESRGIYLFEFDPETARTEYVGLAPIENPSYLTSWGETVYAVSENGDGTDSASAFRFKDGTLSLINSAPTGGSPCNITSNGSLVVTANYGGGDISVFGVRKDGGFSASRQTLAAPADKESHLHCVKFSPDDKFLFAADLGTDRLLRWNVTGGEIDTASLKTFDVPAQSGPRHFVFSDDGESLYLINELSGTVVAFDYNGGDLVLRQIADADPSDGAGSADIVLSPDGRFLYASNRLKNDGIAVFEVTKDATGSATVLRQFASEVLFNKGYKTSGVHPRNLSLSPDGRFLLVSCRDSDVVQIFGVDKETGALTPTDFAIDVDAPVCVYFIEKK